MLRIAVRFLAAATVAAAQTPSSALPKMPDWRSEFTRNPHQSTLNAGWSCGTADRNSKVSVEIKDVGVGYGNRYFEIILTSLIVDGRKASTISSKRVSAALKELNNVSILQGRCRDKSPELFITGFAYDGTRFIPKKFEIDLQ